MIIVIITGVLLIEIIDLVWFHVWTKNLTISIFLVQKSGLF